MRRITSIILILISSICYSQRTSNSILVYADKQDYLMPIIEKKLLNLKYLGKTDRIVSSVTNMNRVTSSMASEIVLNQAIKYYSDVNFPLTEETRKVQETIAKLLLKNTLFLLIRENTVNNYIEYQMLLYRINNNNGFPAIDISNPTATQNFFVNIEKEDFEIKIENAIKALFPNSNASPIARIEVEKYSEYYKYTDDEKRIENDSYEYKYDTTSYKNIGSSFYNHLTKDREEIRRLYRGAYRKFFVPTNEEITLNPFSSTDVDTPTDQFKYTWKNVTDKEHILYPVDYNLSFKDNQLKVKFYKSSSSLWELSVSDGISTSKETVEVISIEKAILFIPEDNRQFWTIKQKTLFDNDDSRYINSSDVYVKIYNSSSAPLIKDKFLLSTLYFKVDTANLVSYKRTLNKIKTDRNSKYYLPQFSTNELFTTLKLRHINNSEGKYKVMYLDRGVISESNIFSVSNRYIGAFSLKYVYNYLKLRNEFFHESEISLSAKMSRDLSTYISIFQTQPIKNNELMIKNSGEVGIKIDFDQINISKYGKTSTEISYGFYFRKYSIIDSVETVNRGNLGFFVQISMFKLLIKGTNINATVGYKKGVEITPKIDKEYSDRRFYLGLGLVF